MNLLALAFPGLDYQFVATLATINLLLIALITAWQVGVPWVQVVVSGMTWSD